MINHFKKRRKVSKATLKRLLALGVCKVRLRDGTFITDWRKIENRFEVVRNENDGVFELEEYHPIPESWTGRQLEHIGDAVFCLAERLMVHEMFGDRQVCYFRWAGRFLANSVMGGTAAEMECGRVAVESGIAAAMAHARKALEGTEVYRQMMSYKESLDRKNTKIGGGGL